MRRITHIMVATALTMGALAGNAGAVVPAPDPPQAPVSQDLRNALALANSPSAPAPDSGSAVASDGSDWATAGVVGAITLALIACAGTVLVLRGRRTHRRAIG